MNTFRHDDEQRRQWVQNKISKQKSVKQICREAQISRATLYNWIDEFATEKPVAANEQPQVTPAQNHLPDSKTLPVHHPATRHRMLLAALDKVDTDKSIGRKLAATLVKRFTLSIAQACEIAGIDEATYGYKPRKPEVDDRLVQQSIVQLLTDDPSKSFDQCYEALRQANPDWTRKQIKRVYREGRLYLNRHRTRKAGSEETILPLFPAYPQRPGAIWNLGAVNVETGWLLFILDDADMILLNTEQLDGQPGQEQIHVFLSRATTQNGRPRRLRVPDEQPFHVRDITAWAFKNKLSLLTLSMGKPENELEVQAMKECAKEQVSSFKMTIV